eukprot:8889185-Heterocapsa_arctica.AAC.1
MGNRGGSTFLPQTSSVISFKERLTGALLLPASLLPMLLLRPPARRFTYVLPLGGPQYCARRLCILTPLFSSHMLLMPDMT